jgi:hypothetical protein
LADDLVKLTFSDVACRFRTPRSCAVVFLVQVTVTVTVLPATTLGTKA